MCAKNYHIWLRRFKDKTKNMHWPRFFGPRFMEIATGRSNMTKTCDKNWSKLVTFIRPSSM